MSLVSFMGAVEIGLIFALVALGVWISFRVLNFPDLTADGSFPLGGAVAAVDAVLEQNPGTDWQQLLGGLEVTPDTAGAADLRVDEDDELASFKL